MEDGPHFEARMSIYSHQLLNLDSEYCSLAKTVQAENYNVSPKAISDIWCLLWCLLFVYLEAGAGDVGQGDKKPMDEA